MFKIILPTFFLLLATVASGATLGIPSADGALTVDGRVEEDIWARAVALPFQSQEFGAPFPAGGEMRAIVRRGYLCLSARLPESGRVVAKSIGRDPVWWREDLVIWTFRIHDSQGRNKSLTLTVNPLGAYSVDPQGTSSDLQQEIRASASLGPEGWSVEGAIPVARLAKIGFVTGERIRVPRPDAPELRWHWPGVNNPMAFELPSGDPIPRHRLSWKRTGERLRRPPCALRPLVHWSLIWPQFRARFGRWPNEKI